jgi:hypothetical protein
MLTLLTKGYVHDEKNGHPMDIMVDWCIGGYSINFSPYRMSGLRPSIFLTREILPKKKRN